MKEGMLLGQGYDVDSNAGLNEHLVVVVKAVQCVGDELQSIGTYGISPNEVAEI